jgi:hypothetical protein
MPEITEVISKLDGTQTFEYSDGSTKMFKPADWSVDNSGQLSKAGADLVKSTSGFNNLSIKSPDFSKQGILVNTAVMTVQTGPTNSSQQATELATLNTALPMSYTYNAADFETVVKNTLSTEGELKSWVNPAAGVTNDNYIWNSNQTIDFQGSWDCIVDSDDFAIIWNKVGATVGQPAARCWIKVDGELVTADTLGTPNATLSGNLTSWVRLSSPVRKQRLIQFAGDSWLYQIRLKNRYDTVRPATWLEKLMILGDSFCARSNNQGETVNTPYSTWIGVSPPQTSWLSAISTVGAYSANVLGFDGVINNSANGTGFFSTFSANGKTWGNYLQRLQAVPTNNRITSIHLWGTGNDLVNGSPGVVVGSRTMSDYQQQIEASIIEAKRINPYARVTVSEILRVDAFDVRWTPTYIAPATTAMKAACSAQGAVFLPIGPSSNNAYGLITGSGTRNNPLNNGNSDRYIGWTGSDNHPNSDAMPYLGAALAEAMYRR